jgi:hypothetical protein
MMTRRGLCRCAQMAHAGPLHQTLMLKIPSSFLASALMRSALPMLSSAHLARSATKAQSYLIAGDYRSPVAAAQAVTRKPRTLNLATLSSSSATSILSTQTLERRHAARLKWMTVLLGWSSRASVVVVQLSNAAEELTAIKAAISPAKVRRNPFW